MRVIRLFICIFLLCMSAGSSFCDRASEYRTLAGEVDPSRLRDTVFTMSSFGSRIAGYPGAQKATEFVYTSFKQLGLKDVRKEEFEICSPVDEGAFLKVGAESITLRCVWPNSVRTSQVPESGLTGKLIYGGDGGLTAFDGKQIEGSIVLMNFNCALNWLNAARRGARAIVFIEPDTTMRGEAETKFLSVPIDVPRFWVSKADGIRLRNLCKSGDVSAVTVKANMKWYRSPGYNIVGVIPGCDPKLKDQVIILETFYDSMSIVPSLAPGAESACGMAAMLEITRLLQKHPPGRTVWLVATDGHFRGLSGMRSFLDRHFDELSKPGVLKSAGALLNRIVPSLGTPLPKRPEVYLYVGIDLSSRSKCVGAIPYGLFYRQTMSSTSDISSDVTNYCRLNAGEIAEALGVTESEIFADCLNPRTNKKWKNYIPGLIASDMEAVNLGGGVGLSFVTTDDMRVLVDTPFDTPDRVNIDNLATQVKTLACLFACILHDTNSTSISGARYLPLDRPLPLRRMFARGGFATLEGRVVRLNMRKSYIPNDPVPYSIVVVRNAHQTKSLMGVRGDTIFATGEDAFFSIPGLATSTDYSVDQRISCGTLYVSAFKIDDETGDIRYASDVGVYGSETYPTEIQINAGRKYIPVVVFEGRPTTIYDLIDPQILKTLDYMEILDGTTNGNPQVLGYSVASRRGHRTLSPEIASRLEDVAVIYTQPEQKIKVAMSADPTYHTLLLLNSSADKPEGDGYAVGDGKPITNTAFRVAKDMWALDDYRIRRLNRHNIVNKGVEELHDIAAQKIKQAEDALSRRDYPAFDAHSRGAWGFEARAYPNVQRTASDVLNGVLFYLALMLPFSYFAERLLFGFANLNKQIVGALGCFVVVFIMFRFSHPAFDIALNPLLIFIAFVMLALSILVCILISGRFETQIKEWKRATGGVHRVDLGRMSVAAAAFSLGISNMRRRKTRTILTCVTLVMLTFTVLSVTSIEQKMRFNKIPSKTKASYDGILLRSSKWDYLQESAIRILKDEYGRKYKVAPRAWYYGIDLSVKPYITFTRGDKTFDAQGIAGLTPEEQFLTAPQKALIAGRWFEQGDSEVVIIPDNMAEALGVKVSDVGKESIKFGGVPFRVVGIVSSKKLFEIVDLDDEQITPADFAAQEKERLRTTAKQKTEFRKYEHMLPELTVLMPYDTVLRMGGIIFSMGIRYNNAEEVVRVLDDLMPRLKLNLFAGIDGKVFRYSSVYVQSGKGFKTVLIPVLIAALIVLNTMLGSVYERVREIGIFSSLGLAPNHIAMLFIAESMVYATIGAVGGYLIGQGASKIIHTLGLLPGLYLNFSSTSAVVSTLVVVGIVLLSTLYPARKASEVATPAIQRTWVVPDPVGDDWKIVLPFSVTGDQAKGVALFVGEWLHGYKEQSIGDFVSDNVEFKDTLVDGKVSHGVCCRMWLAPFDLGVSQDIHVATVPTSMVGVYNINLSITRIGGEASDWKRVNRRFMNALRKQFLIWRTLTSEERQSYMSKPRADVLQEA